MLREGLFYYIIGTLISFVLSDCNVVDKNTWGGLDPVRVSYLARPVDLVIIQHTVTSFCNTDAKCEETARNIQSYHMKNLDFWDIGANFIVGGNGKIYEGTGWIHVGAHTFGYNSKSIGITFVGNFNNDEPTPQMLNSVRSLLKCGVENGHLTPGFKVVGHRQLIATESPGVKLYNKIRSWPEYLEDVSSIKI